MKDIEQERKELKSHIIAEGEELRKSLIDKLFNLNTILSAAFLVLYQLDKNSFEIKILNILPFCSVVLILLYQLFGLRILGFSYYKLDDFKEGDMKSIEDYNSKQFTIILISIIMTIIELIYLFNILLDIQINKTN